MYGTAWTSQYPTETLLSMAKREWAISILDVDVSKIKTAFEKIKQSGEAFPPSLPRFLQYCNDANDWEHKSAAYKTYRKALPKPINREVGREALRELRAKH